MSSVSRKIARIRSTKIGSAKSAVIQSIKKKGVALPALKFLKDQKEDNKEK